MSESHDIYKGIKEGERMLDKEIRDRLQELIEAEPDARERSRLLIMLQISTTLVDNVRAVRGLTEEMHTHRADFAQHIKKELELYNQGKGMWRVITGFLAVAQIVMTGMFFTYQSDMKSVVEATRIADKRLGIMEERVTVIQRVIQENRPR